MLNNMLMFLKKIFNCEKTYDFYLCGPMRNYEDLNKPMFTLVARLLRSKGFSVWSPSEHKSYLELLFAQCMTADLNAVINDCRKIALLPGWRDSLGANTEIFSAFVCGKKAVEVCFDDSFFSDMILSPIDLNTYRLPYQNGKIHKFDPHEYHP